jgi:acetolactate synthase-1/2/3 large subunit
VFLELCLDAQGAPVDRRTLEDDHAPVPVGASAEAVAASERALDDVVRLTQQAKRPIWLLGGGVSRATATELTQRLVGTGVPLMTTWNAADRVDHATPTYLGRPNTWGQRSANIILAQADLIVALGTRLGLQQTGFNWQEWGRNATVVQVDVDASELTKGHPVVQHPVEGDADTMLRGLVDAEYPAYDEWLAFGREVRQLLPLRDEANVTAPGYVCPFRFYLELSEVATPDDVLIPCSSGGANSTSMQSINQKTGQIIITDKGLASMGYGLSGAIGAALAWPGRRTVLVEGDGGFIQNLQELATVAVNDLDLKVFIFSNEGYASIRMTQRNYFGGSYLGCDIKTGLGFPDWPLLFAAFGIPLLVLDERGLDTDEFRSAFERKGPQGFIVPVDPEQTYYPKVTSRITPTGSMESNPLHLMSPDLSDDIAAKVFRYLT